MQIHEISNELLIKASKGDLGAFEGIYRASAVFVYNVALNVVIRIRINGEIKAREKLPNKIYLLLFVLISY